MKIENYKDIIQTFKWPVLIVGQDGEIVSVNSAWESLFTANSSNVNNNVTFFEFIFSEPKKNKIIEAFKAGKEIRDWEIPIMVDENYLENFTMTVSKFQNDSHQFCVTLTPSHKDSRLKYTFENTDVGVWEWNIKDDRSYLSEELIDKFDLKGSRKEIFEQWQKILDSDQTYKIIHDAINNKESGIHKKISLKEKSGKKHFGTFKANVLYDSDNKAESLTAILRFFSDEDLILREKHLDKADNIYAGISDIYYTVDSSDLITFISESVERLMGYAPSELIGRSPGKIYVDPVQRERLFLELQEKGYLEDFRTEILRKDGNRIWASANLRIKYDEEGHYNGYEGTVRDITEVVVSEKRLKESEDRYRQLSEITFEGIIIHKSGVVLDVNKALCKMVGYDKEELIGKSIIDLCVADKWTNIVIENIRKEYTEPYRIDGVKKDGTIFPVELESRNTEYMENQVRVTAVRDLSSKIEFENKLKKREEILQALESNIGHKTGQGYFDAVVLEISKVLEAKKVFIGYFTSQNSVYTLAHAHLGKIDQNIEYDLVNTPCEHVKEGGWCCYPKNIQSEFSQDLMLLQDKYEGYVGVPLYDSKKKKIGILVALFENEILEMDFVVSAMQVFSIRSSVELERISVEEKLQSSKRMLQTILDTIPVRVFWKDKDLKFLGANIKFAEDAGFRSSEEIIGKTDSEMTWNKEAELYNLDDRSVIDTGKAKMNYEEPQTNANGRLSWLRTSKIPLKNDQGETYGVLGIYEDITEKKIAEKAMEESERKFRTLAENVPGAIYLCLNKPTWPMIYLNDEIENLTGYPKERFLDGSVSFEQLIHPDILQEVKDDIQKAIQDRESFHLEYRLLHKDGNWKWVEEYGVGIYDGFEVQYLEGFIHDVTERKSAENAQAESELRFRSLIENLNGVFWIKDINKNKLEYLSPQFEKVFGKAPKNIYDNPLEFATNIHSDDKEKVVDEVKRVKENIPFNSEYRIILETGEIRTIWARTTLVREEEKGIFREFGYAEDITDKKLAEQEIEKLALVAKNTDNAVIITDTDINIEWVNEGFTRITGYALDEVIGKNPGKILQGKATDFKTVEVIRKAISNKEPIKSELINYRKNGEKFWVELNIQPIFSIKGKLEKFISIQSDVTERKESETYLAESEERHRIISEINFDYVYQVSLLDEQLKLDWVSGAFQEITGYTLEEVKSLPEEWVSITVAEDMPQIKEMIRKYMLTGIPYTYEYRIRSKNGEIKWLRDRTKPILDKNNKKLIKIIGAVQDITESKKTEEENKKLALVAEKTDNAVIITDKNRKIEWVNEGFTRITGYEYSEAIGKKPNFMQGKDTDKNKVKRIGNKLDKKKQVYAELVNYRKNGDRFWVELNIQPILNDQGSIEKYISIQSDITDRKNTEERIKKHNVELKKTNEELDNFVYRVSHDLKAPISSAKGLINIAKLEDNPDRIATCLDMIDKSMNRLDKFILDILDYSRNSRVPVEPARIDLKQTIDEILNNLTYHDNARNIKKEVSVNAKTEFYSDHKRVLFVLNNILSNAIKFVDPEKSVNHIKVSANVDDAKAVIECEDNGIGIEEKYVDKIFDMFYRATEQMTGSGLGLYIVKEAIEKLHGDISVNSTFGVGTKFTIKIPNMKEEDIH